MKNSQKPKKDKDKKNLGLYSPEIFLSNMSVDKMLEKIWSKGEIRRLKAQKGIKTARDGSGQLFIKVGKKLFVQTDSKVAYEARVWWEYHYSLKPKVLKWEDYV